MPNAPKTPQRALRIPDDEWDDLATAGAAAGSDRTAIIRELVQWYLRRPGAKMPKRPTGPKTQQVHHRDGDPRNNDPANLELRDQPGG